MAEDPPTIPAMEDTPTKIPGPAGSRWHDSGDEDRRDDDERRPGGASATGPVHTEDAHRDSLRPDPTAPPDARNTVPEDVQRGDERG